MERMLHWVNLCDIPLWFQLLLCSHCKRWSHSHCPRPQQGGSLYLPFQCLYLWHVSEGVGLPTVVHMRSSHQLTLSLMPILPPAFQTRQRHSLWACPTDLKWERVWVVYRIIANVLLVLVDYFETWYRCFVYYYVQKSIQEKTQGSQTQYWLFCFVLLFSPIHWPKHLVTIPTDITLHVTR